MHGIHRAIWPAEIGWGARGVLEMFEPFEVFARVETFDGDVLRRQQLFALMCRSSFYRGSVIDL